MDNAQITSGEVARMLGISTSLIRKLEIEGVTPKARRLSRFRVYSDGEIEALREIIEQRRARQQLRSRQEARAA